MGGAAVSTRQLPAPVSQMIKGRRISLPIQYDQALAALVACTRLDEARTWDNKADALAAWAKIYGSDRASELAKQLKLHAYRRMGELAEDLAPKAPNRPGPRALLVDAGLTLSEASAARCLARMPRRRFERALQEPASPVTVAQGQSNRRPAWKRFGRASSMLKTLLEEQPPAQLCASIRACGDKALVEGRARSRFLADALAELANLLERPE